MRQLRLFPLGTLMALTQTEHGGVVGKGRHKGPRPFAARRPLHVVMRSERARGRWSLLHPANRGTVEALMSRYAARYQVRVYQFANVGNHLHLLMRARDRHALQRFLR